ncbi:hypothetical protein ACIRL0_00480 [Streptomyces sp. NPDC102365]|uniref:hypothetical protein n=1 Tax=Streptomyces sp. NPDC102365 TaxID=3366162 RepID=UPI00382A5E87
MNEPCASIPALAAEPSELATAAAVARTLLADYSDPSGYDIFQYAQAHGALTEALRILLRAVDGETGPAPVAVPRCPAAHPDDPSPCDGPPAVTILDAGNAGANGCEHHGARMLASLAGGRVVALPDAPDGAALRVFKAADDTRPFAWAGGPRTRPAQRSNAENRRRGERP